MNFIITLQLAAPRGNSYDYNNYAVAIVNWNGLFWQLGLSDSNVTYKVCMIPLDIFYYSKIVQWICQNHIKQHKYYLCEDSSYGIKYYLLVLFIYSITITTSIQSTS